MEFWNEIATERSWKTLIELKADFDFILIGGWACYLLTRAMKSQDIDMIVDFETLEYLRKKYRVKKTDFLKKYEAKIDDISVDIYVPFYSQFAVPAEEIKKHAMKVEMFSVPKPEVLLILKQEAELNRMNSVKGQKDRSDIINLLVNSRLDFQKYKEFIKKFGLKKYEQRLKEIVINAKKEFDYLGVRDPGKIKKIKKEILKKL